MPCTSKCSNLDWSPDTGQDSLQIPVKWIFEKDFKTKNCPVPKNGLSYCWSPDTGQNSLWTLQNDSYNFGKAFVTKK